jgi:spore germination protein
MRTRVIFTVLLVVAILSAAAPVTAASAATGLPTWHTVVRGETLFSIGRLYGVSPWAIATANRLVNPNRIYVGQALYIPAGSSYPGPGACGSYHTVQRGDTLYRIGLAYKVSPWSIASANRIYNMNHILVGQRLFIPCY